MMMSIGTPLMWTLFGVFVLVALFVDFFTMNRQGAHKVSIKEAFLWSLIWVAVSFGFVGWLWWHLGGASPDDAARALARTKTFEFITGYLVEKALAVDNIFVFLMVFSYFGVPAEFQKRVLMIGILGALVLRAAMILVGAWLIAQFHWILYIFGAIFAITTDPFIVLTSNVFAILGLRAMYFLLAGMHEKFHLLSYGLALVLAFIGSKMLLIDVYKIPVWLSLAVTVTILLLTMILSLLVKPRPGKGTGAYPFSAKREDDTTPE